VRTRDWARERCQTGYLVGNTEQTTNRVTISVSALTAELRRVIRKGLPVDIDAAGDVLLHLRNVVARAIHPDDAYGRLDSLNETLTQLVGELDDAVLGDASRIIFGLAESSRGTTLTVRRERCADLLGYDVDHFRQHVEVRILGLVGEALYRDLIRYRSRLSRPVTAYETSRPSPQLLKEDITAEEELVCRIWQRLYEVRAERIAFHRSDDEEVRRVHQVAEEHAALLLNEVAAEYVETYGKQYISDGRLDYTIQGLEKLVVWRVGKDREPSTATPGATGQDG